MGLKHLHAATHGNTKKKIVFMKNRFQLKTGKCDVICTAGTYIYILVVRMENNGKYVVQCIVYAVLCAYETLCYDMSVFICRVE